MPEEGGLCRSNLYAFTTGLDPWGGANMTTKEKTAKIVVAPENWMRDGEIQQVGDVSHPELPRQLGGRSLWRLKQPCRW